jgi:NTE family protein
MKLGLALACGGAKGFAHLGVLEVLERENINIDILTGSSVGAVIASMYAFRPKLQPSITQCQNYLRSSLYDNTKLTYFRNYEDGAQTFYDKLKVTLGKSAVFTASFAKYSLFNIGVLQRNIEYLIAPVNIEESIIKLGIVVFDLKSGKEILLTQGPLVEANMASAAIPGIFPHIPGERLGLPNGTMLMDGGIVNPVPADHARELGADVVIAVDISPEPDLMPPLTNTYEVAMRAADLSRLRLKNRILSDADIVISVDMKNVFWADFTKFDECLDLGRKAAERALPAIRKAMVNESNSKGSCSKHHNTAEIIDLK